MAEVAESAEDRAEASSSARAPARTGRHKTPLERKAYAKQLARNASKPVRDRHQRAAVKVHIYNQLLPVLESHARERARLKSFNHKLLALLTVSLLLLGGTVTLLTR